MFDIDILREYKIFELLHSYSNKIQHFKIYNRLKKKEFGNKY